MNWSYDGNTGPEHWSNVCTLARTGQRQSPIDLRDAEPGGVGDFSLDYRSVRVKVRDTGRNYRFDCGKGCRVRIAGSEFQLVEFHFHSPSEHKVDGNGQPIEMHLMHQNTAGRIAVVAVFFSGRAGENCHLKKAWQDLPERFGDRVLSEFHIDPSKFLPADHVRYVYPGSITTPPCTEGVTWVVFKTPVFAGVGQIKRLQLLRPHSCRPLQPLNGREIRLGR
ncbi:MAG: carbonic anhydrase family protein [Planctomycetota bacterium]